MKISYGLTVCNEDKELENLILYLGRIIDDNDEIVIVYDQNRITTEVKKILENYKETISYYPFDFQQNFLENKNYLNSKCTGDYIFQLDADELPEVFLVKNLKAVLEVNPVDVLIGPRKNFVNGLTNNHIQKWGWNVNEKGWVNWPDQQKRIYKNDPSIKWSGHQVHGMVSGYKTYAALPVSEEWSIIHNKTINRQEQQNERYSKIEKENVKVIGITRIRNEENIIQLTLDHVSKLVDEIYVYDDCSTDKTVEICEAHPKVVKVIKGTKWDAEPVKRMEAEGSLRQLVYNECLKGNPDWIYYFDADEFADFDNIDFSDSNIDWYSLRLFDYYITKDDIDTHFLDRKWMGPEFRDILMLFRPTPNIRFNGRSPSGVGPRGKQAGYVKHYGKATTVEDWENACDYYVNHLTDHNTKMKTPDGKIVSKWEYRRGRAIHEKSDFGYDLIQWDQRKDPTVVIDNSIGQIEK